MQSGRKKLSGSGLAKKGEQISNLKQLSLGRQYPSYSTKPHPSPRNVCRPFAQIGLATKHLPGQNRMEEGMNIFGKTFGLHDTSHLDLSHLTEKESAAWNRYRHILPILKQQKLLRGRILSVRFSPRSRDCWLSRSSRRWALLEKSLRPKDPAFADFHRRSE